MDVCPVECWTFVLWNSRLLRPTIKRMQELVHGAGDSRRPALGSAVLGRCPVCRERLSLCLFHCRFGVRSLLRSLLRFLVRSSLRSALWSGWRIVFVSLGIRTVGGCRHLSMCEVTMGRLLFGWDTVMSRLVGLRVAAHAVTMGSPGPVVFCRSATRTGSSPRPAKMLAGGRGMA
jgi:hypothetical protein